jgi:hypothetical protein
MNTENMKRLTAALRSDDYVRVAGQLGEVAEDGKIRNCCLGVASRLAGCTESNDPEERGRILYDDESMVAPPRTQEWLSERGDANPHIDWPPLSAPEGGWIGHGIGSMAELNDSGLFTFPQIADILDYFGIR